MSEHPPRSFADRLALVWATGLGLGLLTPIAQGTIAVAGALVLAPWFLSLSLWAQITFTAAIFFTGVAAASRAEAVFQKKDDHRIVIDEISSAFIMLIGLHTFSWPLIIFAFFANRAVDIWKPGPIHAAQSLPKGWGVMMDDFWVGIVILALLHAIVG